MLDVEDWAEIRRLNRAEGLSIKEITRRMGVARNTVRSALRSDSPPVFDRKPRPSAVDAVEPAIRELLEEFPRMPATVIAERIGWQRSMTVLKDRVRDLRPLYLPPDPCQRSDYRPGELAQWDLWFPATKIPLGQAQEAVLPVIVGGKPARSDARARRDEQSLARHRLRRAGYIVSSRPSGPPSRPVSGRYVR